MRLVDPSIKLIASGSSNYNADWLGWNRTVINELRNQIDYVALHTYIGNRENDLERFLAASQRIDAYIETTAAAIQAAQIGQANPRPIYIAYDEWNIWYRTGKSRASGRDLQFRGCARHGDVLQFFLPPCRRRQDGEPGATGQCHRAYHDQQAGIVPAADLFPDCRVWQTAWQLWHCMPGLLHQPIPSIDSG